ncbi:MAG: c-type cytochrome [Litorilinea sp.]
MHKPWYSIFYIQSPIAKIVWGIFGVVLSMVVILFVLATEETRMMAQTGNWEGRSIEHGAALYSGNCASCHGNHGQGEPGPALNSNYFFTQRLDDLAFAGTLEDYVSLTITAGRPSKTNGQWAVMMPTWSARHGGPMRDDQVLNVTAYVMNWEEEALAQSPEEDPWITFLDTPGDLGPSGVPPVTQPVADVEEGEVRAPDQIFASLACAACHNLLEPQTEDNRGPVGPNMGNLDEVAATRVEGMSASDYVHQSIVEPNAHVVASYMPNLMPAGLADRMTEEELNGLVEWLLDPDRAQ